MQGRTFEQIAAIKKETIYGTGVAPDTTWPVTSADTKLQMTETFDEGRRGVAAKAFDAVPDGMHGEFSCEGFAYPIFMGNLLLGLFGAEEISGAADPYSHTFTMASNPPSFTLEDTLIGGALGGLRLPGFRPGNMNFSFDAASGALTYSTSGLGLAPVKVTPALSAPTAELRPWSGWQCTVTSAGISSRVSSGEINITRELQVVHTATAVQTPRFINVGPIDIAGTLTVTLEDLSDFDAVLADTRQSLVVKFEQSDGGVERSIEFTMSNIVLNAQPIEFDRSGVSVFVKYGWRALYNDTDGGPGTVVLINSRATTY